MEDDDEVVAAKDENYAVVSMVSYVMSIGGRHRMLHKLLENCTRVEKVLEVPPEYNGNVAFELHPH